MIRLRKIFSRLKKNNLFSHSKDLEYKFVGRRFIYEDSMSDNDKENKIQIIENFSLINSAQESRIQDFISTLLDYKGVNIFIFFLILSYVLLQATRFTYIYEEYQFLFNMLEISMVILFSVELVLRLYSRFDVFFLSIWNILDLGLISVALATTKYRYILVFKAINLFHSKFFLSLLSYFRFLRTTLKDSLISILKTATESLPDVLPIMIILIMTLFILSVNLVYVRFNAEDKYFSDLPNTMYLLFMVMSLDGIWVLIDNIVFETGGVDRTVIFIIILITFFFGKCILCNIIVAIMTSNMLDSLLAENKISSSDKDFASNEKDLISYDILRKKLPYYTQTPIQNAKLTGLNWHTVRTYHLLLVAFEDNLIEYQNLKTDLKKIIDVIRDLETKKKKINH